MNGLLGVDHLVRGLLSQPQRAGARTASRNTLGINHPLAESSPVARIPLSMMPFIGGGASGYTQEDLATLALPEETTLFSPLGFDITDKDLARFGLATDALDWVPGAAILGGMATGAGLLGRAVKGNRVAPESDEMMSAILGPAMQRQGLLNDAMVGKLLDDNAIEPMWSPKALKDAANQNHKSRDILIGMAPQEFLRMTDDLSKPDLFKKTRIADAREAGNQMDSVPMLGFDNMGEGRAKVVAHEGRHRALRAIEEGHDIIPVLLNSQEGGNAAAIRWGSQEPGTRDYVDDFPTILEAQGKKTDALPFPVQRNQTAPSVDEFIGDLLDDGLPMDEASRVHEATFGEDLYHGTGADIDEFKGITWGSKDPSLANEYAGMRGNMGRHDVGYNNLEPLDVVDEPGGLTKFRDKDGTVVATALETGDGKYQLDSVVPNGFGYELGRNAVSRDQAESVIKKWWKGPDQTSEVVMPIKTNASNAFDADLLPKTVKADTFLNEIVSQARKGGQEIDLPKARDLLNRIRAGARMEESGPHYSRHDFWNYPAEKFGEDGAAAIQELMEMSGFDSIKMMERGSETIGILNPKNIRSKFAKFDPAKRNSANLLATAAPIAATGLLSANALRGLYEPDALKDDEAMRRAQDI